MSASEPRLKVRQIRCRVHREPGGVGAGMAEAGGFWTLGLIFSQGCCQQQESLLCVDEMVTGTVSTGP